MYITNKKKTAQEVCREQSLRINIDGSVINQEVDFSKCLDQLDRNLQSGQQR